MAGRTGAAGADGRYAGIVYLAGNEANGFQPEPPAEPVDIVYLCSPNNPTGAVATRAQLERWVAWARGERRDHPVRRRLRGVHLRSGAAALDLRDPGRARRARSSCAASRSAPASPACAARSRWCRRSVTGATPSGERVPLHALWARRHTTKFNGVSYVVQRGAAAVYSPEGREQTDDADRVLHGERAPAARGPRRAPASRSSAACTRRTSGSRTPDGASSWDFFDRLLDRGARRRHAGRGLRAGGRGLLPALRVQLARERRGSDRAHPQGVRLMRTDRGRSSTAWSCGASAAGPRSCGSTGSANRRSSFDPIVRIAALAGLRARARRSAGLRPLAVARRSRRRPRRRSPITSRRGSRPSAPAVADRALDGWRARDAVAERTPVRGVVDIDGNLSRGDCTFSAQARRTRSRTSSRAASPRCARRSTPTARRAPTLRGYHAAMCFASPDVFHRHAVDLVELSSGRHARAAARRAARARRCSSPACPTASARESRALLDRSACAGSASSPRATGSISISSIASPTRSPVSSTHVITREA